MSTTKISDKFIRPYKGAFSYKTEDAEFFHGRKLDNFHFKTLVLGCRFSALHAPSGAGKTSLIQASFIPSLEEENGFVVALSRPSTEPVITTKKSIFLSLLPDPTVEAACLRYFLEHSDLNGISPSSTIRDVANSLNSNTMNPRVKRVILKRFRSYADVSNGSSPKMSLLLRDDGLSDSYTPSFSRVLLLANGADFFIRYLHRLYSATTDETIPTRITESSSIAEILEFLDNETIKENYSNLVDQVEHDSNSLFVFLDGLLNLTAQQTGANSIVTILIDQFEEFFTLIERSNSLEDINQRSMLLETTDEDRETYKVCQDFFHELGVLVRGKSKHKDAYGRHSKLPVKVIFSLRDEFYAKLDGPARYIGEIDRSSSYRLNLLAKEESVSVISEPAALLGYRIDLNLSRHIISELSLADGFVDPGHIQIVCDHLWQKYMKNQDEQYTLDLPMFQRRGEKVQDIIKTYFHNFLEQFEEDERYDVLRILNSLFIYNDSTKTASRTRTDKRNLFSSSLIAQGYKDDLIKRMEEKRIVRSTSYKDMTLLEITHEFLIGLIKKSSETFYEENPSWLAAERSLVALDSISKDMSDSRLLSEEQLDIVTKYKKRLSVNATASWLPQLAMKSLVQRNEPDTDSMMSVIDWTREIKTRSHSEDLASSVLKFADRNENKHRAYNQMECGYVLETLKKASGIDGLDDERLRRLVSGLIRHGSEQQAREFSRLLGGNLDG